MRYSEIENIAQHLFSFQSLMQLKQTYGKVPLGIKYQNKLVNKLAKQLMTERLVTLFVGSIFYVFTITQQHLCILN